MGRKEYFKELFKNFDDCQERIENGIEANRKGDALITITDKNGCAIKKRKGAFKPNRTRISFRRQSFYAG